MSRDADHSVTTPRATAPPASTSRATTPPAATAGVTSSHPAGLLNREVAAHLRLSKGGLLNLGSDGSLVQAGGAYIGDHFAIPSVPPELSKVSEPAIETFVVDRTGACVSTGSDQALINHLQEPAERLAGLTLAALADLGIVLEEIGYLTGSVTPVDQVTTTPHVDDDQYVDQAGVGIASIAASHGGPRLACQPVDHLPARSGLPLEFAAEVFERFDRDQPASQRTDPERIVVFPQFGQVHSGPAIASEDPDGNPAGSVPVRTLLVFRVGTVPDNNP